jgi:hypothetical protein
MGLRHLGLATSLVLSLGLSAPTSALAAPAVGGCYGVHGERVCGNHSDRYGGTYRCIYVTRAMVEAAGWQQIFSGGGLSGVGFFADGTVVGIPVGSLLGLIGLAQGTSGAFVLWWADSYFRPGWYCGRV